MGEATQAHLVAREKFPDHEGIVGSTASLYEQLLQFDKAYDLLKNWTSRHSEGLSQRANFAETHFLTGRYAEAVERLAPLLASQELDGEIKLCLRALEIAALVAIGDSKKVSVRLQALHVALLAETGEAASRWTFDGVKAYVERDVALSHKRTWLLALIAAMQTRPRAARIAAVAALIKQPRAW